MEDIPVTQSGVSFVRANEYLELGLNERLQTIEQHTDSHVLVINGPIYSNADDDLRTLVEARKRDIYHASDRLIVILTTSGGQIEPVQRIAELIREHYEEVWFVVPNYAYSAGTILAMSGDKIMMDYYGRLGPVDPQIENRNGQLVPALGYLARWNELMQRAKDDSITLAEIQVMLEFDQGDLFRYDQARERSVALLKDWLVKYKFRDWKITNTTGKQVTSALRKRRAESIARKLSDPATWHSHGHGISRDVLTHELGLRIDNLEQDEIAYEAIRSYDHLLSDYLDIRRASFASQVCGQPLVLR